MSDAEKSGVNPVLLGGGFAIVLILLALFVLPAPQIGEDEGEGAAAGTDVPALETPRQTASIDAPQASNDAPLASPEAPAPLTETEDVTQRAALDDTSEAASPVTADAPSAPPMQGPTFDTFRVEVDGSIVIAGRTAPNQIVDVMLAGQAIDRVTADESGTFVAFPVAPPSEDPRRLVLVGDPDGAAIPSDTSYIVAPIAAPMIVAEAEPDTPVQMTDASQEPQVSAETTRTPQTPALSDTGGDAMAEAPLIDSTPVAPPTVLQADAEGVQVVQGAQAQETDNVALDTITYDPEGEVQLTGRATSGEGEVQVYIDNRPLAAAPITDGGDWRLDLPQVDTGTYTLRVDEVDTSGDVVSRIETPFRREEPAQVAAVLAEQTAEEGFEVAVQTVQAGSSLWAIAEDRLGDGILYVEVFEANRDLIRDPDLIYPGQIFRIPSANQ